MAREKTVWQPTWTFPWRRSLTPFLVFVSLAKEHTAPIPGLMKLVQWVKEQGLRRAAVSNSPRDNVEQVIEALGLTGFFEIVVIGNECERPKPYPDPYLKALEHFGATPDRAIVFEVSNKNKNGHSL